MPTITRWFRVTHDINGDPEMWELREKFGDRAGFVWLECLSIADRNSGVIGTDQDALYKTIAAKCRVYSPKVKTIFDWMINKGWIARELATNSPRIAHEHGTNRGSSSDIRTYFKVVKWSKYNKTRDVAQSLSYPTPTPNHPKIKNQASPAPSADSLKTEKKTGLDPCIKDVADRIYFSDRMKLNVAQPPFSSKIGLNMSHALGS